ncbi:hypothetical protein EDB92DRAFT_1852134, partial [Lactarius akahatsu]
MDILFNGDFCLFLFWLLGSTPDFTPGCKFDRALAPQGEITFYNVVGIWWSGPLLFTTPLSSLSHCSQNFQYILIFCYDLISTDPTLPTVFFLGRKDHGKR